MVRLHGVGVVGGGGATTICEPNDQSFYCKASRYFGEFHMFIVPIIVLCFILNHLGVIDFSKIYKSTHKMFKK